MSKKSRAHADMRKAKIQTADCLASQKKHIRHASVECFIHSALYGLMTVVFAVALVFRLGDSKYVHPFLYAILAIFALLTVGYGVRAFRFCKVNRLVSKISYATEERVSFRCRRVRFMVRNISKWNSILFCIVFHAQDGRVFYYVYGYPEGVAPEAAKILRQRLNGADVTLTCYQGTTAVKEFNP